LHLVGHFYKILLWCTDPWTSCVHSFFYVFFGWRIRPRVPSCFTLHKKNLSVVFPDLVLSPLGEHYKIQKSFYWCGIMTLWTNW